MTQLFRPIPATQRRNYRISRAVGAIRVIMLVVCAAAICAPAFAASEPGEPVKSLLKNGDFEQGAAAWWGDGKRGVENGAMRIESGYACQDKIAITGGASYKISGKYKGADASPNAAFAQLSFRGGGINGGWFGPASIAMKWGGEKALFASEAVTSEWQTFSVVVQAPAGVNQMLLYLRKHPDSTGSVFYDDIRIEPTTDSATKAKGWKAGEIKNHDFSQGAAPWWGDGKRSVENGAMRVESGFACQDKIPIEGGKRYRFAVKIKTENTSEDGAFVQLSYRGSGVSEGWRGANVIKQTWGSERAAFITGGDSDWQEFSCVIAPPEGSETALIYLRKKSGASGVAWFDDITLTETNEPETTAASLKRDALATALLLPAAAGGATASVANALAMKNDTASGQHVLAQNGATRYRVHVGTDADLITLNSARELALYLGKVTGAEFLPLSHDKNLLAAPLLIVGRDNALARALCRDVDFAALGADGFIIRSYGAHILIAGNTSGGTMYGVNWFLDHRAGVKWLAPDYEHIPRRAALALPAQNETQTPRFTFRQILGHEGQDKKFAARNLLNGNSHGAYGIIAPPEIDHFDASWQRPGMTASFNALLPSAKYSQHHSGGQLAMMSESAREAAANEIRARLDKEGANYGDYWFGFMDNDWGWDMDPASRAFAKDHGDAPSAPRFDMAVDVLNRVRKTHPRARIAANAYHWSFTPPTGMTLPADLLIYPMTIHVDYSTPLNAGRNAQLGRDLEGWNAVSKNILLWDHVVNFHGYIQPTPNLYPIAESIRWLATLPNIHGYFAEAAWNTRGSEFASLRTWLMARLLWDPSADYRAAVAEYCEAYFGAAAAPMLAYINYMHEASAKTRSPIWEKTNVDAPMLTLDFVLRAEELLSSAAARAKDDPPRLRHIEQVQITLDYVILLRRFEFAEEAAARGIAWNADYERRLARVKEIADREKIGQYRQGGSMKEFFEIAALQRKPPAPPDIARNLPRADWKEVQDLGINRYYATTVLVQDPAASDGVAARLNADNAAWVIQAKLHLVPEEGLWDIYADLRVETTEPLDDDATVARVGAAPPMNRFTPVRYKEIKDGAYIRVKAPGGPFRYSGAEGDITYISGADNKQVRHVYVDRFIFVRAGE